MLVLSNPQAFDRIKALLAECGEEGANVSWTFEGLPVCLRAWKSLHALGTWDIKNILKDCVCSLSRCDSDEYFLHGHV